MSPFCLCTLRHLCNNYEISSLEIGENKIIGKKGGNNSKWRLDEKVMVERSWIVCSLAQSTDGFVCSTVQPYSFFLTNILEPLAKKSTQRKTLAHKALTHNRSQETLIFYNYKFNCSSSLQMHNQYLRKHQENTERLRKPSQNLLKSTLNSL